MSMIYIKVVWKHSFPNEPVLLFSELDEDRRETRKVEVFGDGRIGYASAEEEFGGTILGEKAVPPLSQLASDPQFEPIEITPAEFEKVWAERETMNKATSSPAPMPGEIEEAKKIPNGWVYRISGRADPGKGIPPEAILGAWKVDANGQIAGEFISNPKYDSVRWPFNKA